MVAEVAGDDARVGGGPRITGLGEDVVDFLGGVLGAEGGLTVGAVEPIRCNVVGYHGVRRRGVEVAGDDGGILHGGVTLADVLSLRLTATGVEGLEVCAGHHERVARGEHDGCLKDGALLHLGIGVGKHQVFHLYIWVLGEQSDAVIAAAEAYGGAIEAHHAAVVGQFGDEVAPVLVWRIGAVGVAVHLLQSDKVGGLANDEVGNLLQRRIMPGVDVERHHFHLDGLSLHQECHGKSQQKQSPFHNSIFFDKGTKHHNNRQKLQ